MTFLIIYDFYITFSDSQDFSRKSIWCINFCNINYFGRKYYLKKKIILIIIINKKKLL